MRYWAENIHFKDIDEKQQEERKSVTVLPEGMSDNET